MQGAERAAVAAAAAADAAKQAEEEVAAAKKEAARKRAERDAEIGQKPGPHRRLARSTRSREGLEAQLEKNAELGHAAMRLLDAPPLRKMESKVDKVTDEARTRMDGVQKARGRGEGSPAHANSWLRPRTVPATPRMPRAPSSSQVAERLTAAANARKAADAKAAAALAEETRCAGRRRAI